MVQNATPNLILGSRIRIVRRQSSPLSEAPNILTHQSTAQRETREPFIEFESLKSLRINWPVDDIMGDLDEDEILHPFASLFKNKPLSEFVIDVLPPSTVDCVECKRNQQGHWFVTLASLGRGRGHGYKYGKRLWMNDTFPLNFLIACFWLELNPQLTKLAAPERQFFISLLVTFAFPI